MKELKKIKQIIERQLPDKKISTLLTVDAMLGKIPSSKQKYLMKVLKLMA